MPAFKALAPLVEGRVGRIKWFFLDECPDYLLEGSKAKVPQPMCKPGGKPGKKKLKEKLSKKRRKKLRRRF